MLLQTHGGNEQPITFRTWKRIPAIVNFHVYIKISHFSEMFITLFTFAIYLFLVELSGGSSGKQSR